MNWLSRVARLLLHGKQDARESIRRGNFYNFAWPIEYTDGTVMFIDTRKVTITGERDGNIRFEMNRRNPSTMTRAELIQSLSQPG